MKKKQVLVLLMAATLTVGTVSPVYAMETESENCEMMTEMVETVEEISSVSETEGTFSEEIAEFATTSELGVVDEAIAPDAVAVLSETVAGETLVPTQVKESVIVENTMTLSDTELTVYMKRGIGIYPIFSGEEESVTWTTTDPSVTELIYDPSLPLNIMISGLKPGTATVTCTSASGLTASCHVTVKQLYHAESVSINQQNVAMKPGEVMTLDASVYPVEATPTTELEWYSSDPSIVEVDSQTGEITALQPGTVTITVWTRNKKSGTCSVTVKDKESVDKTALKIAIETAKEALKEEDKYTEESVKVLKAAVAEAEKVAANEKATQESVDAATQAVEEAIEGLEEKPAVPEVNKDALKEAIETAKEALKEEDKYTEE
ncbi:MAG: Ig domain-containing protein, partial [Coprococcus sp.]